MSLLLRFRISDAAVANKSFKAFSDAAFEAAATFNAAVSFAAATSPADAAGPAAAACPGLRIATLASAAKEP